MTTAIFVYHRIVPAPQRHHDVAETRFAAQLAALAARAERIDGMTLHLPLGRAALLSFDDGTVDHGAAAERLESGGLRGLFLVVAGRLGEPGRLTGAEVGALARRGHGIGAHGMTHQRFDRLSGPALTRELVDARARLADLTGQAVDWLAPPGGICPPGTLERALEAGYRVVRDMSWGYAAAPPAGRVPALPVSRRTSVRGLVRAAEGHAPLWLYGIKEALKRSLGETRYARLRDGRRAP